MEGGEHVAVGVLSPPFFVQANFLLPALGVNKYFGKLVKEGKSLFPH